MTYEQAIAIPLGSALRTYRGEVGTVVGTYDSGVSILFSLWSPAKSGGFEVHNMNCWPVT